MNNYKSLINKNNLKVNKITYNRNSIIIYTPLGLFMIKENEKIEIYDYLISRGFDYLLPIVDYDNSSILFKYEESIDYDTNEKLLDYIKLLALLHNKTSYYINISEEENKSIYDNIIKNINELKKYYDDLASFIESKEYYSPNEYLFIRNISIIYQNLFILDDLLKKWYKKYKNISRKRVCTLHNNYNLDNLIKTKNNIYLYNFEKSYIDSPIYDLNNIYREYFHDFDFKDLYNSYLKIMELNDYEKELLIILNMVPQKIVVCNGLDNLYDINKKIKKYYTNFDLLNFKKEKDRSTHKSENNK